MPWQATIDNMDVMIHHTIAAKKKGVGGWGPRYLALREVREDPKVVGGGQCAGVC